MQTLRNASFLFLLSLLTACTVPAQETKVISTLTVRVVEANEARKFARVQLLNGKRVAQLTREDQAQTVELPVGATIFLRFASTTGTLAYSISPPRGVLESAPGPYHLPRGVIGLVRTVGAGEAAITIREIRHGNVSGSQSAGGCSNCWSGYILGGGPFSFIQGQWTVPTIQQEGGSHVSSAWIGIDGNGTNSLIQVGTEQDYSCCLFPPNYYAWYQVLPADQNEVGIGSPVSPGDVMMAWISALGPDGRPTTVPPTPGTSSPWVIVLNDVTKHWVFSKTVNFAGTLSSAEWILEATTVCDIFGNCSVGQLANYGSVSFDILDFVCPPGGSGSCTSGSNGLPSFNAGQAISISQQPGPVFSTPSNPDGDSDGFTVAYSYLNQFTPQPPGPIFCSTSLPNAVLNQPYSQGFCLFQDVTPQLQLAGGSLPPGLTLESNTVSGTPTAAGAFAFSVLATDGSNPGASAQQEITLNVLQSPPPPDFGLSAGMIQQRHKGGACAGSTTIKIIPINGFTGSVTLSDQDPVLDASIIPSTTSSTSTLTVSAPFCDGWPSSTKVTGQSGNLTHTIGVGINAPQCGKPGSPPCP